MDRIAHQTAVFVITGYPDCQLHYQGFKATVIDDQGEGYLVRDADGQEFHCEPNELLIEESPSSTH